MVVKNGTAVTYIGNSDAVLQNGLHYKVRIDLRFLSVLVNNKQICIT